jgi:hypothetical protein
MHLKKISLQQPSEEPRSGGTEPSLRSGDILEQLQRSFAQYSRTHSLKLQKGLGYLQNENPQLSEALHQVKTCRSCTPNSADSTK